MKYLDYEVIKKSEKTVDIKIIAQDIINEDEQLPRLNRKELLRKRTGNCLYKLCTVSHPEYNKDKNTFYLMGRSTKGNLFPLRMPKNEFPIFALMVIEYNLKREFEKRKANYKS